MTSEDYHPVYVEFSVSDPGSARIRYFSRIRIREKLTEADPGGKEKKHFLFFFLIF